jgi:hypothetical protein
MYYNVVLSFVTLEAVYMNRKRAVLSSLWLKSVRRMLVSLAYVVGVVCKY